MGQIFCDILDLQISLKLLIHCLKQFFCDVFLYFEYIKIILTKEMVLTLVEILLLNLL